MKGFLSINIFFFLALHLTAQNKFSKFNFAYQYDKEAISAKYRLIDAKDSLIVYLKVASVAFDKIFQSEVKRYNGFIDCRITNSYESKTSFFNANLKAEKLLDNENNHVLRFKVPKPTDDNAYLFVAYYQKDNGDIQVQDIPLKVLGKDLTPMLIPFEMNGLVPIFENYILKRDSFIVKTAKSESKISFKYYKYNFPPASPPMVSQTSMDDNVRLLADSLINPEGDIISFGKKGNYVSADNTREKSGLSLLVIENQFPKVSKTKELIDPTIYIASDDERRGLKSGQKPKVKLDDFWLNLGQDKEFSRKMIRNYYKKIEEANYFFTNHKEGWKTDMGMIYIIFGKPDYVYKQDLKETWKYKRRPEIPAVNFVFHKKTNPFGDHYYEIQLSEEYATIWYNTVELWRKGILEK